MSRRPTKTKRLHSGAYILSCVLPLSYSFSTEIIAAEEDDAEIESVMVIGTRSANYTEVTENTDKLLTMPGALGDPLGAVTALPGVVTPVGGGEPAVRGSAPGDNQYYIDGLPAGYLFHQFNTSVLDENVVQDFQLYTAGFGPRYSNATGAIFDIRLRDPAHQDLTTKVTLSMLRSGVFVEGGVSENSAFYASLRYGMLPLFVQEDDDFNEDDIRVVSPPKDSDYLVKYVWDKDTHKLTLNIAGASDSAEAEIGDYSDIVGPNPDFAGDAELSQRFNSQGITWQWTPHQGIQLTSSLAAYQDADKLRWGAGYFQNLSRNGGRFRLEFIAAAGSDHTLTLGSEVSRDDFSFTTRQVEFICTDFDVACEQRRGDVVSADQKLQLGYASLYLQDFWQVTGNLELEYGVQGFTSDYNDQFLSNPRMGLTWYAGDSWAVVSSVGRYSQIPEAGQLTDDFGNPNLEMSTADHFTLGFKGDIGEVWDWSIEGYHKQLDHIPLALDADQVDAELRYVNEAEGEARGVDIWLNRNYANGWYGWISLSYSESTRTNTRTDETRDYFLDTPFVFNAVATMDLTKNWHLGIRLTAQSGQATTKIIGVEPNPDFPDHYRAVYGEPYADRLPTYARLDIRFDRKIRIFGGDGEVFIDIINATNRRNVSSIGLDYEEVEQTGELATQKSEDMGLFPSVGMSFSF